MRVAFVGLGAMGLPMARNLAKVDGVALTLFDLSPDRLAQAAGIGTVAETIGSALADADVVFSVLPADQHVRSVAADVAAHGHAGQLYVDFSTISPHTIEAVAADLARVGIETVGIALTRSTAAAQAGTLALFVGGSADALARLRPLLDAMATDVLPTESIGAAKSMKIVNNMVVACLDILACETLVLGHRLGHNAKDVISAMAGHGADSWALTNHIVKYVLPDDLGPGRFSTRYMAKDVALCADLARSVDQPAPFTGLAQSFYRGVSAHGHGDDYHMIVIRWLEQGAAIDAPVTDEQSSSGDDTTLVTLAEAAAAVQTLVTVEALTLATCGGLALRRAADYLEKGSGGSASVRAVLAADPAGLAWDLATMAGQLDAACALAQSVSVPAVMFESARHVARMHRLRAATVDDLWAAP
ncbi:NAD(P)-dependent oxidoreductase [Mycolicibacterium sp.]|uniref:NAD(P)-dependent oxidoreductase n=1 Tax=Mycolicibacterium sp. TaxID=2320850 RepID=UPI003D0ED157